MKAAERADRNAKVLQLFLGGASYEDIAPEVGLSASQVSRVVQREFAAAAKRRGLLTDEAFAIWQERSEALFHAHWGRALDGDHRSAEICRKILAQQARLYGLADSIPLPAPSAAHDDPVDDESQDELARLRAQRGGAAMTP